ncbi:MSMEG_0567/Sll0786 family nitrogen starvation N-acetyltransferase [Methylopila henanensis]|uniref:MSMEG_0567/Sll0786 family nitrogen starvation N-acetyltransferase n=1 Tax=Methylopila henanensis TaxID=873516 RepID=A0ABW4K378_9HYPH
MLFEPVRPFVPAGYQIKWAVGAWERRGAAELRRAVFCDEQKVFERDDRDAVDDRAIPLVAVSSLAVAHDAVVGTVRIHEEAPDVWWGSRLAVAAGHRRVGALGAALIRLAVSSARARGCTRFFAHVQSQNGPLFQRLRWSVLDEVELHGRPHLKMEADLAFYPPFTTPETGFYAPARRAA